MEMSKDTQCGAKESQQYNYLKIKMLTVIFTNTETHYELVSMQDNLFDRCATIKAMNN